MTEEKNQWKLYKRYYTLQEKVSGARKSFWNAYRRCNYETDPSYKNYGARGIKMLFQSSDELIKDIGPRPSPKYTLDRVNNDGNYEVGNVRWGTRRRQAKNRRKKVADGVRPSPEQLEEATRMGRLGAHLRHHLYKDVYKPLTCEFCRTGANPRKNFVCKPATTETLRALERMEPDVEPTGPLTELEDEAAIASETPTSETPVGDWVWLAMGCGA